MKESTSFSLAQPKLESPTGTFGSFDFRAEPQFPLTPESTRTHSVLAVEDADVNGSTMSPAEVKEEEEEAMRLGSLKRHHRDWDGESHY